MIVRGAQDHRALCGARIDWLACAFRVGLSQAARDLLDERAKLARKHGRAGCDFVGDLWEMRAPKGPVLWLLSEARAERLEVAFGAPGSYVSTDGEVIPGWNFATHASSVVLVTTGTRAALERSWRLARKAGEVYEGRARRLDLTGDFSGVLLGRVEERGWKALAHVRTTTDLEERKEAGHVDSKRSLGDKRLSPALRRAEPRGLPEEGADRHRGPERRAQLYLLPKQ